MRLSGKKAIVTGASQGIGQAIALGLAKEGADIAFSYRGNEAGARETVEAIRRTNRNVEGYKVELLNEEKLQGFIDFAFDFLGEVDILVNNAGITHPDSLFSLSKKDFDEQLAVNAKIPLNLIQKVAEKMIEKECRGSIINISSILGQLPAPKSIGYCCSKACLDMITKCCALELAPYGIRVNNIAPGYTNTPMNEELMKNNPHIWEKLTAKVLLEGVGQVSNHVGLAIFLASDESSWLSGSVIPVDGAHALTFACS